jgi:enamine deaminase RidA (YjgF/YER057c/UK114 family)
MALNFRAGLAALGFELPPCAASAGKYVGHRIAGDQFWCVQGPLIGERLAHQGVVGRDLTLEDARSAARQVALNILAQLDVACGSDMERVAQVIRLGGYVNAVPGFTRHSEIMNAASEIFLDLFGERGGHTRFVAGCSSLPYDLAVEIEAVVQLR